MLNHIRSKHQSTHTPPPKQINVIYNITPPSRHSLEDDNVPREREVTPDVADDFIMTNAGNFAKPSVLKRLRKHIEPIQLKSELDMINKDFSFHHSWCALSSLNPDHFLNQNITIKYFNRKNGITLRGRLTCIGHCGAYRIENVCHSYSKHEYYSRDRDYYWLHLNSTRSVHSICDSAHNDITHLFTDVLKLKMITYFLYLYGNDHRNVAKYLTEAYVKSNMNKAKPDDDYIQTLRDITIDKLSKCSACKKSCKTFLRKSLDGHIKKGYFSRHNWDSNPRYFKYKEMLKLIVGYKDLILDNAMQTTIANKSHKIAKTQKFQYFDWN